MKILENDHKKSYLFSFSSIKGIVLQLGSVLLFVAMNIFARMLYKKTTISPLEVLTWRNFSLMLFNTPFLYFADVNFIEVKPPNSKIIFFRALSGVCALLGYFVSNYLLPPSIVSAILKINPLITSIISWIILHEKVSKIDIIGMIVCFFGVSLIVYSSGHYNTDVLFGLGHLYKFTILFFTAIAQSISAVLIRSIGQTMHYLISPMYLGIAGTIFSFPFTLGYLSFNGFITKYNSFVCICLILVGVFGWMGQATGSKALQIEKAGRITALNCDTAVLLLFDVYFFGERITLMEISGIILIMSTVLGIGILKGCNCIH